MSVIAPRAAVSRAQDLRRVQITSNDAAPRVPLRAGRERERIATAVYCEANFGAIDGKTANGLVRHSQKYKILSIIDSEKAGLDAGMVHDAYGISAVVSNAGVAYPLTAPRLEIDHKGIGKTFRRGSLTFLFRRAGGPILGGTALGHVQLAVDPESTPTRAPRAPWWVRAVLHLSLQPSNVRCRTDRGEQRRAKYR